MKSTITSLLIGALTLASHAGDSHPQPSKTIVETAVAAGSFKTLAAALGAADLVDTLNSKGPFTVFAPTDEAFARLPEGTVEDLLKPENKTKLQSILTYHVIPGQVGLSDALKAGKAATVQGEPVTIGFGDGKVQINGATLLNADLKTSNGVIHVIDSVLLPPEPKNDIAAVAKKAGQFNTLLAAVEAAGLTSTLTGKGAVTVLAPTDAAFKALPKGTVESLLKPENRSKLTEILAMHVVKGSVSAGTALNTGAAQSVNGKELAFSISDGTFKVNGATIVTTDIQADNGVIHVIDAVLLPAAKTTSNGGCKPSTAGTMSPAGLIEAAIKKGVPVFNHGDHEGCARIYMTCAQALTKHGSLDCSTRNMLSQVVAKAKQTHCTSTRAWVLRSGLDHTYAAMNR